jgi:hypothetical protein
VFIKLNSKCITSISVLGKHRVHIWLGSGVVYEELQITDVYSSVTHLQSNPSFAMEKPSNQCDT